MGTWTSMSAETDNILAPTLVGMEKMYTLAKMPPTLVTTSIELAANFSFNSLPEDTRTSNTRESPIILDHQANKTPIASPSKDLTTNVLMNRNKTKPYMLEIQVFAVAWNKRWQPRIPHR